MHKKRIAALTLAAIIFNFSSNTVGVLAHEVEQIKPKQGISSKKDVQSNQAKVSKFDLLNNKNLEKYNKVFKLDKSKIIAINNNGGNYPASELYKAIDNNFFTSFILTPFWFHLIIPNFVYNLCNHHATF